MKVEQISGSNKFWFKEADVPEIFKRYAQYDKATKSYAITKDTISNAMQALSIQMAKVLPRGNSASGSLNKDGSSGLLDSTTYSELAFNSTNIATLTGMLSNNTSLTTKRLDQVNGNISISQEGVRQSQDFATRAFSSVSQLSANLR